MTLIISIVHSCGLCFSGHQMRSVALHVEKRYRNAVGESMRFHYVLSMLPKLCSRTKHTFAGNLFEVGKYGTTSISNRGKLLDKISVVMAHDDCIENGQYNNRSNSIPSDPDDDCNVSVACKKFPSIILGSSPPVELFDGSACYSDIASFLSAKTGENFLLNSTCEEWVQDSLDGTLSSLYSVLPDVGNSSVSEEYTYSAGSSLLPKNIETGTISSNPAVEEDTSRKELKLQNNAVSGRSFLDQSVGSIPGLSKRHQRQLDESGFHTLGKLLHHFPRTYADLRNPQVNIYDGQYLIFIGKVLSSRGIRASYSFSFLEVVVGCEIAERESNSGCLADNNTGGKKIVYLHLKKFFRGTRFTFQPFLRSLGANHKEGEIVCVSGKVRTMQSEDHYEMREYNIDVLQDEKDVPFYAKERPYPIYPSKKGLTPTFLRDIIARGIEALPVNIDPIPEDITQSFGLLRLHDAYNGIHQPKSINEADLARKRFIFDEFFYLQLARLFQMLEGLGTTIEKDGLLDKYRQPRLNAAYMKEWTCLTQKFLKALPYSLTESQMKAVAEIIWDLKRPIPMNRLLQGDVGCGKTVVAFLACMEVIGTGYQAAFMVPTELLAIQHYEHLLGLLENMEEIENKPSVALLTGSTPSKQSRMIRQSLQTGETSLVIGTHSLISEKVEFSALRLAVVDEQHRFGVVQRGKFSSKLFNSLSSKIAAETADATSSGDFSMAPHVLAMSATPIPRTLALALYGDMSLTHITDCPPGRLPVKTYSIVGDDEGFEKVYEMMLDELQTGGKVYLVYPVIEQSEQLPQLRAASEGLQSISYRFQDYNCGLLHGRMKGDEKEEALRRFRNGDTQILLSTQVIEVGVDIPDASMMVVMNAERFGIAQLHQLRGRVGRGMKKSRCILVASTASSLGRLKVLENMSDGFHLAKVDLLLRGPGDLLGKKQSGHIPEFPIARLEVDGNILEEAHLAALKILSISHDLEKFPALKMELSMRQPLCLLGD
ncbi:ATP-dependent DNA helicase homolog RECG, chloroplastic isoform X1 [Cucurbita moschata]|uniref:DNA 3'-5' helicase n=2 Tax=Cucurbita moschata TaxID=3662 RepID=A0A6J1FSV3_CUCMO|nr:ATP-dependent DNA helicase homolog RECG, chloroplastic isoform X1 [Cucurbita moschata]XP_022941703.1 ATP-dependent DNA helicase homolog RECG, chloroplastic isoform X1 [Cucurbita moschata]